MATLIECKSKYLPSYFPKVVPVEQSLNQIKFKLKMRILNDYFKLDFKVWTQAIKGK